MEAYIGEIAGLAGALGFAFTSTFFTLAGRKLGAIAILAMSLPISWVIVALLHWLSLGEPLPLSAPMDRWVNLSISSLFGFVISSIWILKAFQYIGPRLTLLVGSLAPVLSSMIAWVFLGEALPASSTIGICLVILGILWVVSERSKSKTDEMNRDYRTGLLLAFGGALGQALSFVFSSMGVAGDFPPLSASLMRITAGVVAIWITIALQGNIRNYLFLVKENPRSLAQLTVSSICGPVFGASMMMVSLQLTSVGVASTLINTTPIMVIPIGYFVFKERITARAVTGTGIAIVGIAFLFT